MLRIGIIACKDYWKKGCPGYQAHILCFLALEKKQGPLGHLGKAKIVAMQPCPGCPGSGRLEVAQKMVNSRNIDLFVFPSCVFFNNHCPTAFTDAAAIEAHLHRPVLLGSYLGAADACSCATVSLKPGDIPSINECRQHLLNLNYLHYLYEKQTANTRKALQILTLLKAP